MTEPESLAQRVAAELRAEMAFQKRSIHELGHALGIGYKAAKARYDGDMDLPIAELPRVATWLGVSVGQLTTGERDRARAAA